MAYCAITDVEAKGTLGGVPFSSVSTPTDTAVNARITYRAAEINSRLSVVGVTVPVDPTVSPNAFALLLELNALGAAADAQRIAYARTNPNESKNVVELERTYRELLDLYAGRGTKDHPGNPALLQDAVFSNEFPETMTKRVPWSGAMQVTDRRRERPEYWLY